jgi:hypothetical protein
MVLSGEELVVLRDVISQINATAGYSYGVLVDGTSFGGMVQFMLILTWVSIMAVVSVGMYKWAEAKKAKDRYSEAKLSALIICTCVAVVLGFALGFGYDAIMAMFKPEYVVIHGILN